MDDASAKTDLMDRARGVVPVLRERAVETNRQRSVPEETIAEFWNAGLFGVLKPKLFGGREIRFDDFLELASELGRGDGSAAWVYAVVTVHELQISYFPREVQEEVWAGNRVLMASSFAPTGRAEPAEGGYRVSGKWSFCSGVDHAQWMLLGGMFGMAGDPPLPDIRYLLVPIADCQVIDDWHVMGLAGTGSKSVVVDDAFVPENRVVSNELLQAGRAPGGAVHEGAIYRAPMMAIFPFCVTSIAPGLARGALEQFLDAAKERAGLIGGTRLADMRQIQMRVAEASALIDAAELLYRRSARETIDKIESGEELSLEHRMRSRRDQAYSVVMATRAVELLFKSTGGYGLFESHPVQRAYRDLHAVGAHIACTWDLPSASYGSVAMGGGPQDMIF